MNPDRHEVTYGLRLAELSDVAALTELIECSVWGLAGQDYSSEQLRGALAGAFGVDTQLISDRTYYVCQSESQLVACGGWSFRRTLFGSDARTERDAGQLVPGLDAARVRAFFVRPGWARRGLGRQILSACEEAARIAGFTRAELMGTLPGQRLYAACGYRSQPAQSYPLPNGHSILFVPMSKSLT